jgi:GNAT superfamily N-acetyltransferase
MKNHANFKIIQASHEDIAILAPLFDAYRVFYEKASDLDSARKYLWERISNLESVIFLAMDGEQGLGFTQLYPTFESLQMKRLWILYDLYVTPSARRRGVGRALMDRASNFAQATGAIRMTLTTAIENKPAQALYESQGWIRDVDFYYYELDF